MLRKRFLMLLIALLSVFCLPLKKQFHSSAMWAGYHLNHFARELGKDIEKLSRPLSHNLDFFPERLKNVAHLLTAPPLAVAGLPLSLFFFTLAAATDSRLEIIQPETQVSQVFGKTFSLMSLNSCFQEGPFAPLTGGMTSPFEPVGNYPTRISAVADWIGSSQTSPDIFVGQEFYDIRIQDAFVEELKKQGYHYFILDRAPHPVLFNSGLFVASKRELGDISFIPFALEDRQGVAKFSQQGAVVFHILDEKKRPVLRVINTHLNYGEGQENQEARNLQLKKYLLPLLSESTIPSLLVGDLNFDTTDLSVKQAAGLEGYVNVFEGKITSTDEGKIALRGKQDPIALEKIDGLIIDPAAVYISQARVDRVEMDGILLSDHFSLSATIQS